MELDARRLYLAEGYSSLFTYCTHVLHMSEHAAYNRIEAARAARRFPAILQRLADGGLNLAVVRLVAPHLTEENHVDVLEAVRHKSKRDVEQLVAHLSPKPDVRPVLRKLPAPPRPDETLPSLRAGGPSLAPASNVPNSLKHVPDVKPLAPDRYKIQFTVDRDTYDQLRRVQDVLRHSIPDGDLAAIFARALRLLRDDLVKRKLATTNRPRASSPRVATSRHIPAAVKREVWRRDNGHAHSTVHTGDALKPPSSNFIT